MKKQAARKHKPVTTIEGLAELMVGEFAAVRAEMATKDDIAAVRAEMAAEFVSVRAELREIRNDIRQLEKRIDALAARVAKCETR